MRPLPPPIPSFPWVCTVMARFSRSSRKPLPFTPWTRRTRPRMDRSRTRRATNSRTSRAKARSSGEIYADVGEEVQKGWDMDIAYKVTQNLQFIATFYRGTVRDQKNDPIGD